MMKKSLILLLIVFLNPGIIFCQAAKDSAEINFVIPNFYDRMSPEESWEIQKSAYVKQLKSEGLTSSEIEVKMKDYEKQKKEFLKNRLEQRKEVEKLRKQAELQRKDAEKLRAQAKEQRIQSDILRKQAEKNRMQSSRQREQAEEIRIQAAAQRVNADKLRKEADLLRERADVLRTQAEAQRNKAEEWRNRFDVVYTQKINIKGSKEIKPISIKIDKKTTLLINISGSINTGSSLIEIFSPSGKKEGELSLVSSAKSKASKENERSNTTSASLHKTISDAETGEWQIKVSSHKSEGELSVSVAKQIKPTKHD